jgi:hypothetical protein
VAVTSDYLLHQLRGRAAFQVGEDEHVGPPPLQVRLWNQGTFQNLEPAYRVGGVQTPYQTVPERPRGGANVPLST